MKKISAICLVLFFSCYLHAQKNITLRANLKYVNKTLAGIWGYVDGSGNEYALVGTSKGMSIVDVTNPSAPVEKFFVTASTSIWHEVKTYGNYAYMSSEGGGGVTIVDLSGLPASIKDTVYTGDGAIAGLVSSMHTLAIDKNFLYMFGTKIGLGGAYVADLVDPWKPKYVGKYDTKYVHDGYVRNDTLYAANINNGIFSIVDFKNKSVPVLLTTHGTPKSKTHNTWLSTNGKTLFTTDEVDYSCLTSYDISDLSNVTELDRMESYPGSGSVIHNTHLFNDYSVTSWYKDGVVIVDCSRPSNMIKTGFYDTDISSGIGENSCWDVYPFLPSGTIVASTISDGLFVLTPTYKRACYLEGTVTDSASGAAISNVKVEIVATDATEFSSLNGKYETGFADAGTYTVTFSVASHIPKTITGVTLTNGVVTNLNVKLAKRAGAPFTLIGKVMNVSTNAAIFQANVAVSDGVSRITLTSNASGIVTINNFYPGTYKFTGGKWGYVTQCIDRAVTGATDTVKFYLVPGIYDDFTFDFGWKGTTTTISGLWKREVPRSTILASAFANPANDVTSDCSNECFVTGNDPTTDPDFDDVENGAVTLTSPVFSLTAYKDPYISYNRWFFNAGADSLNNNVLIKINNNINNIKLEQITASSSQWISKKFRVKDFVSLTDSVKITFKVTGTTAASQIVESGVDLFMVTDSIASDVPTISDGNKSDFQIYPNPLNEGTLNFSIDGLIDNNASFMLLDVTGRTIALYPLKEHKGKLQLGNELSPGIYFIQYQDGINSSFQKLIIQ